MDLVAQRQWLSLKFKTGGRKPRVDIQDKIK
jgi:hypothetical protein